MSGPTRAADESTDGMLEEVKTSEPPVLAEYGHKDNADKPMFMKRTAKELLIDLAIFLVMTAYAIVLFMKAPGKDGFEVFVIVYVFISLRLLARHVSMSKLIYNPIGQVASAVSAPLEKIPAWIRSVVMLVIALAVILIVALVNPPSGDNTLLARLQSFLGIVVMLAFMWATSSNRAKVPIHTVAAGMFLQFIIALIVLRTQFGFNVFKYIANKIALFLSYSSFGLQFLIGTKYDATVFAASVFPAIIFFCSFVSVVYYWGGMQYIISKMAWFMMLIMDVSGAEAVVAAASPFIGQGENALLVRPFVEYMTNSELHAIMTAGFATISGSVFLFYTTITGNPSAILTACVMSIPASLLLSKMRIPETEEPLTRGTVRIPESKEKEANFLHAAGNGSATGIQLVLLIAAALIAIIALYDVANDIFGLIFSMIDVYDTVNPVGADGHPGKVTIQLALSYVFTPAAWFIGIPGEQARKAGEILAIKMVVNEFVAYQTLGATASIPMGTRAFNLMVYALCGFANIASIGIQLGTLGAIAPTRRADLSSLVVSAMLTGTVSTWITAAVAGTLM
ncbi:hypothetical protein HK105_201441 [Polyrhizophydium stewartii]|uniref:Uncharacterized protein n=1 Tax=Polyrhizophydium stewartii TaxID=2732419 RepID=A0ABR4NI35_9FUNG